MAIKKIPHASLQWDEIANDNFTNLDERVTKIGGGTKVVQIDDPFTFLNGAKSTWTTPYIRYVQLDGYKLIMLNVDQMEVPYKDNYVGCVMLVPKSFAPNTQITIDLGMDVSLQVGNDGKCYLWFKTGDDKNPDKKANVSVMYLRKDD